MLILKARLGILNKSINTHQVQDMIVIAMMLQCRRRSRKYTDLFFDIAFDIMCIRLWPFNALTGLLFVSLYCTLWKLKHDVRALCVYSCDNVTGHRLFCMCPRKLHKLYQNTGRIFQQLIFRRVVNRLNKLNTMFLW